MFSISDAEFIERRLLTTINIIKILWKTLFKAITFQGLCRLLRGELLVIVFLYDIRIQVLFI